jgi:hypothetical protein
LTQIDHNYPYISYYPTKTTVTGGEKANLNNRMHNPDDPYTQTDYFPYTSEESKKSSQDVLEQDSDADNSFHGRKESKDSGNTYAELPYYLSSQASRTLMMESSAPGQKITLNNSQFSEEAKKHAKE